MKKLLFLVLLFSNFFGFAQYTAIPDLNFEKALINKLIDTGAPDGKVLTANIIGVTDLSLTGENIMDLTGIQIFVSLRNLQCGQNLFTSIDLSKNTFLENLDCTINKLTSLDVSKNLKLTNLACEGSQLTNLDVSKNTALKYLNCGGSQLTTLDVSKNAALGLLICRRNQLTSLDITNNKSLLYIDCIYNNLINLNLKNGNNVTMGGGGVLLQFNPNLSCIQVDNAAYSDTYWSYYKDATARFSEDCSKIAAIAPPKITATGNQSYCPGTSLPIVESVSITFDPLEPTTDAVTIQISSGYVINQDQLSLAGTNLGIDYQWIPSEGKLKLYSISGKLPYTAFEAAIKNVMYNSSSTSPSGTRTFSISLGTGQLSYLPSNKHFYEYVSNFGITWSDAKVAAAARIYYGLQGYLATLTSAAESQLAGAQASGAGWIGGSDAETEGTWKWVTGPEGLANGGTGTTFWIGGNNGTTTAPYNYANWNTPNEPNNTTNSTKPYGEDYAHITAPAVGRPGTWNDLANQGDPSGNYQAKGYIVEYGGMVPGDVDAIQISASTTMQMSQLTITSPNPVICATATTTLQASSTTGTINWYDALTGGNLLQIGNSYTTSALIAPTKFYIDNGCSVRTPITVMVNPLPTAPLVSNISYCQYDTAVPLTATKTANCTLNWYTLATGGTANSISPTPSTVSGSITSYFVSQTLTATGCEGPRSEIKVNVNPLPIAPLVNSISYCLNSSAVPLIATPSTNCTLNWYNLASGGTASATSPTPTTTTVGTTSYYVSQTTALGCEGPRSEIKVTINPLPIAPSVNDISYCFNTLTTPLITTVSANCTLNWYTTDTGGTRSINSPTPITNVVGTTSYFVSQTLTASGCEGPRSELKVTVNPLPIVKNATIIQCDTDLNPDGKTLFNLTVNNNLISGNFVNENFSYYKLQTDAISGNNKIPNELAFENTIDSMMDVWVQVANKNTGCFSVAKLTLIVPATNILSTYKLSVPPVCDDYLDAVNNNRDGIATFDFSWTKAVILSQPQTTNQNYTLKYYKNKADALSENNPIINTSNYRNIGYPKSQDIWVRIESNLDNTCVGLGPYITLNVEALPFANPVTIPRHCDDNQDGKFSFDTSTLESKLLNGQKLSDVTLTYFDQNGSALPSPFPATFETKSQTIKAVVTNKSTLKCYDETTIQFVVDTLPQAFAINPALTTTCDDELDPLTQDGKFAFDTSTFENTILGGQLNMKVTYTLQDGTIISNFSPTFITGTQNITATVYNPSNPICTAITTLNFVVNPLPKINLNTNGGENELVCSNLPTFFVTLNAGIQDGSPTGNYSYFWTKDGVVLSANSPTLKVNAEGTYTVEVMNSFGCSRIRTIKVTASDLAHIDSIAIVDMTDINSVTVNISGKGKYEYSLDEPNGFWQDSNFFDKVPAGIHEVYINDKNGCGVVSQKIAVIGAPKFFTPNNDGYNDYWSVKGVNDTFNSKSIIYIFDRYGKLLKQWVPAFNQGWDGLFNGAPLPADDYWYTLQLEDGREAKGHFSLKR